MTKWYLSILKTNMSRLKFRLEKVDKAKNHILKEMKNNEL